TKTITFNVVGDTQVENSETFNVTLNHVTGAVLGTAVVDGTIVNDDGVSGTSLSLSPGDITNSEGNSGLTSFVYTVTRSGDTSGSSSAAWTVTSSGSTPANAADFANGQFPSGTVSFSPGDTNKTITVNVAGDTQVESNEGFALILSSPSGATIAVSTVS